MKGSSSGVRIAFTEAEPLAFLQGGGDAARRIRAIDWSRHTLGRPAHWSPELKAALSLVLNSSESMVLAWGPDLTFFFNDTYARHLGPRQRWAMGAPFREVWKDAWAEAKPIIDEALAGRSRRYVDLPWRLPGDTGDSWWTFSYSRVLDRDGEVAGLFILTNDTTDRVCGQRASEAATAALRKAEGMLRQAQEAGCVGVFVVEADGSMHGTPEFFRIYGVPQADNMRADAFERLIVPEDQHKVSTVANRAAGLVPLDVEYRIRRADTGELRWIARRGDIEKDREGRFLRFVGVASDITPRKHAEGDLLHLNATLERKVRERTADRNALWQLSRDLMLRCTFEGVITAVNPAWSEILAWSEAELVGSPLFDLVHADDLQGTIEAARALAEGGGDSRRESRYRCRDGGYRWITWSARAGDGMINAVGRDVTVERERAERLRATEDQLRQAQKMEAVGQLTGGIAHDFNNLLTGILGSLHLLDMRIAQGRFGELERHARGARAAAERAAALTHRLLAFSRRQTLDPKPVDMNGLVAGLIDLVGRAVGPAIAIEPIAAPDLWPTLADPGQLENALLNLCINARDAMSGGGRITIETANLWLDETTVGIEDLRPGPYVSLAVTDTGGGMPPEVVARALDPFFTTKPIGQGTGLGLSMIFGFARQSGGMVRITSAVGQGTTVRIVLPRHEGDPVVEAPPQKPRTAPSSVRGETVLVVDDEPGVRRIVSELLEDLGYHVEQAADGPSGLRLLRSDKAFDLLVSDIGLPGGMSGRQMAEAARATRPDLKVLFITGHADDDAGIARLDAGMHVMAKPFDFDALVSRIQALIAG